MIEPTTDINCLTELIYPHLRGESIAMMIYGSRARGSARTDSDIDVLQIVKDRPRSYSHGSINIASYTADHLTLLATRGSLFVRHLKDEGKIISDPNDVLSGILASYQPPKNYNRLKRNLCLALAGTEALDADQYARGLLRMTIYVVRSAVYIKCAELGNLTFDRDQSAEIAGYPKLATLLRTDRYDHIRELREYGYRLLEERPTDGIPRDLPSLAIWARGDYSLAGRLLESALAGASTIDYTSLTLPVV
ncbi:nucleotidyltransferase domain-containing protein [Microbispora sp. SCL1-1]|uniref:nucleotidyltransferase domain-containing protein n=1 Tax=Microbispora TaxID=2005 RepID=UPI0011599BAA|nr:MULTISPECIES: nucleotidyltransferase domain-containing protein [unclassified Microbispora]NJP30206.1 nucleotidyltransferase domain-containing protein [Microbispora sp. CL1-1]TQS02408.1 nucleotidyltransferase domain-containing protein [Microbispora sp. SCL1-1]